jgi:hypothetical protein
MQFLVALLVAISTGTWVYTRVIRSTSGNTKSSLIGAGIVGGFAFLVIYMLARTYLN